MVRFRPGAPTRVQRSRRRADRAQPAARCGSSTRRARRRASARGQAWEGLPRGGWGGAPAALALDERDGQAAHGEHLVRAERAVGGAGAVVHVDHVIEAAALLVPEARAERAQAALEEARVLAIEAAREVERVQPQRLDLD